MPELGTIMALIGSSTNSLKSAIAKVTPEQFGAKGDGTTDDTQAIQDAVDAGYEVRFGDNKTYLLTDAITIDHDAKLVGGKNTLFVRGQTENNHGHFFSASGTLKATTTLTSDYSSVGGNSLANCGNKFTLTDMTDVEIGDILIIKATDQYYSYARQYYYLGATLLVTDIYDGHIYTHDSMPFDIENTENVTVEVYSAPSVSFENMNFTCGDLEGRRRWYVACIELQMVKNSTIKNCTWTEVDNGIITHNCVCTHIEDILGSKSMEDNETTGDSYGININSSSNTVIERVTMLCAQEGIDFSGTVTSLNNYIYNCNIGAECRAVGIGFHENAYNTVIEDCVVGGMSLYGTVVVNRCKVITNKRPGLDTTSISIYGSHDPKYARFHIYDCEFEENDDVSNGISITRPLPQTPIQSFDNIIGEVIIKNCKGGLLRIAPTVSADVTSNTFKRIEIDHWQNCYEIYHTEYSVIDFLSINESTFINKKWINKHADAFYYDNVGMLIVKSAMPPMDKMYADITKNGASQVLPEGVGIAFSSSDASAHYMVCGRNIASNDPTDYQVGSVSGSKGNPISFTLDSNFSGSLSADQSGHLVLTRPNKTNNPAIFPKFMLYVDKPSTFKISAKIKNTGNTTGQGFRAFICIIDADTGLIVYRDNGDSAIATSDGVTISHSYGVGENSFVIGYLGEYGGVANAVTEISEYYMELVETGFDSSFGYEQYRGSSRTGDGSLTSVEGKNHIMCSPASFHATFKVDKTDV